MKKNFFYNFLLTGSNLLFPLLTFTYVSRIIGADGLGIVNFITSYSQNYMIIAALGIPIYGIREIAKAGDDVEKRSKIFFEILIIHFTFSCLLFLIYLITIGYHDLLFQNKNLVILGGSLILINVVSFNWLFAGVSDFKYITIRSLIIRSLSVISVFLFVRKREDFGVYLLIYVITMLLTAVVDIYSSRRFIRKKGKLTVKGILSHLKPVALLGTYTVLTSIYTVIPNTLLGFFSSKAAVGYYSAADKIIRMAMSFFTAMNTVMIPKLNLAVECKKEIEYRTLIEKSLKVVVILGIPLTVFIALFARSIIGVLGGAGFTNSIVVIQIMSPVILFVAVAQVFVYLILSANRKDKEMVILSIVGMAISLIINLAFIPVMAERATGFSQLIAEFFVTFTAFFFCRRIIQIKFHFRDIWLSLTGVIPFVLISLFCFHFFSNDIFTLVVGGVLCSVAFLVYQFLVVRDKVFIQLVTSICKAMRIGIFEKRNSSNLGRRA
ncbi:MAG: flippase [Chitinophagaceae bacterium]|nr:flippase [Chitinophagaceae bacterium]